MSTQLEDLSGDQRYKFEKLTNLQFNTQKVITTLLAIIYFMLKVFQHQILEKYKKNETPNDTYLLGATLGRVADNEFPGQ